MHSYLLMKGLRIQVLVKHTIATSYIKLFKTSISYKLHIKFLQKETRISLYTADGIRKVKLVRYRFQISWYY